MARNERPVIIVKKKKKGSHGYHGGAWKVAYAIYSADQPPAPGR
jgi:hypothetical protein